MDRGVQTRIGIWPEATPIVNMYISFDYSWNKIRSSIDITENM